MFIDPEPIALLICIRRALLLYLEQPERFLQMQKRAMHTKFTWEKAAKEFEVLFINTIQQCHVTYLWVDTCVFYKFI
jgi:starch synthase